MYIFISKEEYFMSGFKPVGELELTDDFMFAAVMQDRKFAGNF